MKPDWDKLAAEYEGSAVALVADVDCTKHRDLCELHGVKGFPTLKYGDPNNLEDYKGGRKLGDLQKFAKENLKPLCGPMHLDLCDDAKKKEIETFMAMGADELSAKIAQAKKTLDQIETDFRSEAKALQDKYAELEQQKEKDLRAIKDSGLRLMEASKNHKQSLKGNSDL
eukprot:gnl/MRDRNA2_/MRDRNA2_147675_c0_seq1.p1 gnl/MRDRNA2_/MRDRNA2_147675_c0~~gnl/MRDRNA2_/MRDRNA2_147675_c0_seq1.p1  ORF type:complete len:170 (+),score=53.53 gnl/MRDRNA2_/MRDRNA2_147675_c0_seq1:37-546(+)